LSILAINVKKYTKMEKKAAYWHNEAKCWGRPFPC